MNNLKKSIISMSLLASCFVISGISIAEYETVPRAGVNVGNYYLEEYTGGDTADNIVLGPTAGILWAKKDHFFDIAAEIYSFSTDSGVDITRTELAATYGFHLRETMYGIAGFQYAMYGDSILNTDIGTSYGPFVGISINNLRMGQDSSNVFSIAAAVLFQETEYANQTGSDISFNMKVGYRKAGEPHSYGLKFQTFGSDLHAEWISMFNYSYQFTAF